MKVTGRSVDFTATLVISEKELEMLHHLASYNPAERIFKQITSEYLEAEWRHLFAEMQRETTTALQTIQDARAVFEGRRKVSL